MKVSRFSRNIRLYGLLLLVFLLSPGLSARGGNYSGSIQNSKMGNSFSYSVGGVASATLLRDASAPEFDQWHSVYMNASPGSAEFDDYMAYLYLMIAGPAKENKRFARLVPEPGATIRVSVHGGADETTVVLLPGRKDKGFLLNKKVESSGDGSASASIKYDPNTMDAILCVISDGFSSFCAMIYEDGKQTIERTGDASVTPGESGGERIPWEVIAIPTAIVSVGVLIRKRRNKKPDGGAPEAGKQDDRKEEDESSTFMMYIWKDFDDKLVLDDPPVEVGARIEEVKYDGQRVDRPDLTEQIRIFGADHANVGSVRTKGRYRMGSVTALRDAAGNNPGTATVTFSFTGAGARFNNNVVFRVEDPPGLQIGDCLSFAAGQGKQLFMEFELTGAAHEPSGIEFSLTNGGDDQFDAAIERSDENPQIFRILLTECGKADQPAGTVETYPSKVVVSFDNRKPLEGSFTVYRIHLGLDVRLRALKAFLVEFDSNEEHDFVPMRGSKKRLKYAESRVDLSLTVVDEDDENQFKTVLPDYGPVFEFSDDLSAGSTLFTPGQGDIGVPTRGTLYAYENLFFRDLDGSQTGAICEKLKFKYEFRGVVPGSSFWGIIRATDGFLVAPNRSHAKVTVKVGWHGQEFVRELVVPVNSQPYRDFVVPPGGDLMQSWARFDHEDEMRREKLHMLQQKICFDMRFVELRPLFYKVTVMLEGYHKAFGFFEPDYQGVMDLYERYCAGEIGTYFVARETMATNLYDDLTDAAMATAMNMRHSFPVIACRIGLGLVTGGLSELVWTPADAYLEMKEYVDKGGESAWEGFKQISLNIIKWEAIFFGAGKAWSKLKQVRADRLEKLKAAAKESAEATRVNSALARESAYSSGPVADKFTKASRETISEWDDSLEAANNAIRKMRQSGDKVFNEASEFAEACSRYSREDARNIYNNFKNVMNNPTASAEEVKRATLALQGNKTAQEFLKNQADDLLRANFNANIKRIYDEVDPVVLNKLADHFKVDPSKVRVAPFKATGNADDALYLGRTIGADRDVTYQIWDGKKWVDISEDIMEIKYSEAFSEVQYGWAPKGNKEVVRILKKLDQDTVNGLHGLESYGDDLERIVNPALQHEKLVDPERISTVFVHKCQKFIEQGESIKAQAKKLYDAGFKEEAMHIFGYGDALVQEGIRQNVKQFQRILLPRYETALMNGKHLQYRQLFEKIRVLQGVGMQAKKETLSLTLEEARLTLQSQYGCTVEDVLRECAEAVKDINAVL